MTLVEMLEIAGGGFVTGILGALLGIGGGVFLVPFLVLFLHMPIHEAVAISLVTIIATSCVTGAAHVKDGTTNLRLAMTLEVASVAGALAGGLLSLRVREHTLMWMFSGVLLLTAAAMMRKGIGANVDSGFAPPNGRLDGAYTDPATGQSIAYGVRRTPLALGISGAAGVVSSMLGIGGGVIQVPVLTLCCGVPIRAATATSNLIIGVTTGAGAALAYLQGRVDPHVTAPALFGVLIGSVLGTRAGRRVQSRAILLLFAGVLAALAVNMVLRAMT